MRTRLSTKGQVIIPQAIRDRQGWEAGTDFEIEERAGAVVLRPVLGPGAVTVDELLGILPHRGPPKTLDEMERGIARGARRGAR